MLSLSFPSIVRSLSGTLESHSWAHHIKAHREGQQLPNLLLLREKGVLWVSSRTKTHHPPLGDYRLHWWHLQLVGLAWPWPARQLSKESRKGVSERPSTALKWSVLPQNLNVSQSQPCSINTLWLVQELNSNVRSTKAPQLNAPSFSSMEKAEPGP